MRAPNPLLVAAELGERAAQLRLKDDHERDGQEHREASQQPPDDQEVENLRDEGEGQEDEGEPDKDPRTVGPTQVEIGVIKNDGEDHDLDARGPVFLEK